MKGCTERLLHHYYLFLRQILKKVFDVPVGEDSKRCHFGVVERGLANWNAVLGITVCLFMRLSSFHSYVGVKYEVRFSAWTSKTGVWRLFPHATDC